MKKPSTITLIVVIILALILITIVIYLSNKEKYAIDTSTSIPPASSVTSSQLQTAVPSAITTPSISISDTFNKNAKIPETTILISENDNTSGLFHLGMTRDAVTAILKDKGVYYNMTEISNEGVTHGDHVIDFYLFENDFNLFFNKQTYLLYKFQILGENPVSATSTRLGFNFGDTFDRMIELYGKGYTVIETDYEKHPIYSYKIGDHYFLVQFLANGITSWGVSNSANNNVSNSTLPVSERNTGEPSHTIIKGDMQIAEECLTYMFGGYNPKNIVQTLGEPVKKELVRWYFKQDVEIDVFLEGHEIGNYVYIGHNCNLKTDRGIGIGSSYDDVIRVYKDEINPDKTKKDIIIVGDGWVGINFVIRENKVSSIYIAMGSMTREYFGEFTPDRP